jgi:bacteriocin-like protein
VTDVLTSEVFQQEERLLTAAKRKEEGKFMNEQTKSESKLDDLTKTTEPRSAELTAEELEQVSGGQGTPTPWDVGQAPKI